MRTDNGGTNGKAVGETETKELLELRATFEGKDKTRTEGALSYHDGEKG